MLTYPELVSLSHLLRDGGMGARLRYAMPPTESAAASTTANGDRTATSAPGAASRDVP